MKVELSNSTHIKSLPLDSEGQKSYLSEIQSPKGGGVWAFRIRRYNLNVWNYGHGGLTARQIQHHAKKVAKSEGVKYAFVMAGINTLQPKDVAGAEETFKDYQIITDTLLKAGIIPIVQFTLYRENEKNPDYIDRLNELLMMYAKQKDLWTINLNPILAPRKSLLPEYSKDGVHLTETAYKVWSLKIIELLDTMDSGKSYLQMDNEQG